MGVVLGVREADGVVDRVGLAAGLGAEDVIKAISNVEHSWANRMLSPAVESYSSCSAQSVRILRQEFHDGGRPQSIYAL